MKRARTKISALLCIAGAMLANPASAAGDANAAQLYQQDRAACTSGQSHQDRQTCLREAGAALYEARRGGLNTNEAAFRASSS